ncbi:MAG: DUF4255 domain-containing protein [Niabella sp.]
MIQEALKFLVDELNQYFSLKLGATTESRVVLGNIARAFDNEGGGSSNNAIMGKAVLSLVNVEEDKVSKVHENYVKTINGIKYKNPPVLVNLYVLFSVNRTDYNDCLKWLSLVIQYFQHRSVFTGDAYPSMNPGIQKMMIELVSMSFEQVNHLWGTLGGKYIPSVLYKIRQLTIDENEITAEGMLIRDIQINEKLKNPLA